MKALDGKKEGKTGFLKARLGVVLLSVLVLPHQRGKARRFASFGNRDVIEELIANSFMRVRLENQDSYSCPFG